MYSVIYVMLRLYTIYVLYIIAVIYERSNCSLCELWSLAGIINVQELELDEAEHSLNVEALKAELSELQRSKTALDSKVKLLEYVVH